MESLWQLTYLLLPKFTYNRPQLLETLFNNNSKNYSKFYSWRFSQCERTCCVEEKGMEGGVTKCTPLNQLSPIKLVR